MKDYATNERRAFVRTLNLMAAIRRADRHETALAVATGLIFAGMVVGYLWHRFA